MSFPKKVAVIGANGFVGSRIVETFHLAGLCEVVPVVRGVNALPRLSRFDLGWKLADARKPESLAAALAGCDAVVHAVVGDPGVIEAAAAALVPAAVKAGIRRVVYLSTASVHGQNPAPGTTEDSLLSDAQEIDYNNAKVRAERRLFADAARHSVELIALRPSIVFGPRDRWVTTLADELQRGVAWLVNDGSGICNTVHVDNLVHAVRLSLSAPASATGHAYLVGDGELVTWADFYRETAAGLGIDPQSIHRIPMPAFPAKSWLSKLDGLRASPTAQKLIAQVPRVLKGVAKGAIKGLGPEPEYSSWYLPRGAGPSPSREMVLLQQCGYRLPSAKAERLLGYQPPVSFATGLRGTLDWLKWTRE